MSVLTCDECHYEFNGSYWEFDHFGDYTGVCPRCGSWRVENVPSYGACTAKKIIEKEKDWTSELNILLQQEGNAKTVKTLISVERVGGQDHDPKHKAEFSYKDVNISVEGYHNKKDIIYLACKKWFEEATEEARKKNTPAPKLTLNEKLGVLKKAGIVKGFVKDLTLVHSAYYDYINNKKTAEQIREDLNK